MNFDFFKRKIVKDTAFLSAAGYTNQLFQFIRGFIVARLLDPTLFGYLSGARLVLQLTPQMHLGTLHGLSRYLSVRRVAEEERQYRQDVNSGITFIILISAVIALAIIIYTYFIAHKYNPYAVWGIRIFAVIAFVKQLISIFHALFRAEHDFKRIGISQLLLGGGTLVLSIIFISLFGFYGAIVSFLISNILSLYYLYYSSNFHVEMNIDMKIVRSFIVVGAPISFFYFNNAILHALDKIIIINFLNVDQLGYYAIALPFFSLISKVPSSISYIVYPKMLEIYGKGGRDISHTRKYFKVPTILNSIFVSYSIAILYFSIDFIFAYALPRYVVAVPVVKILSIAMYFNCMSTIAVRVFVTKKSYRILFVLQVAAMLVNLILNLIFVQMGAGIQGVAWATGIAYVLYSTVLLLLVVREYYDTAFSVIVNFMSLMFPLFMAVLVILAMGFFAVFQFDITHSLREDLFHCLFNSAAFTVFIAPVYVYFSRKVVREMS